MITSLIFILHFYNKIKINKNNEFIIIHKNNDLILNIFIFIQTLLTFICYFLFYKKHIKEIINNYSLIIYYSCSNLLLSNIYLIYIVIKKFKELFN